MVHLTAQSPFFPWWPTRHFWEAHKQKVKIHKKEPWNQRIKPMEKQLRLHTHSPAIKVVKEYYVGITTQISYFMSSLWKSTKSIPLFFYHFRLDHTSLFSCTQTIEASQHVNWLIEAGAVPEIVAAWGKNVIPKSCQWLSSWTSYIVFHQGNRSTLVAKNKSGVRTAHK